MGKGRSGGKKRLRFLPAFLLLLGLPLVSGIAAAGEESLVYVGTYQGAGSEGIYAYRFSSATGAAKPVGLAASTNNPSFLAADPKGRFLYAVNESDTFQNQPGGAVSVFEIDRETTGGLKFLQQVSSFGAGPAHLSLDRSGRFLMVANYNSGNAAVFPIQSDGRLGEHSAFVQHAGSGVNPERQRGPHAHFIGTTPDNRFAVVADLGIDKLMIYRFDAGKGTLAPGEPGFTRADPGSGPRHAVFSLSGDSIYVINELVSSVTRYSYNPDTGELKKGQMVSTLPENYSGKNTAAGILLDQKGKFLYVSNRGDDSIVVFGIDPATSDLTFVQRVPSGGRTPRHFEIDPTGQWLLAANQDSNTVTIFKIDPASGQLSPSPGALEIFSPVCIRFVPRSS